MDVRPEPDSTTHPPGQPQMRLGGFLAANPASVDLSNGKRYLTRAIRNDDIQAVRTHLAAGANPLFPEPSDGTRTALSCAAIRGKRDMVQLLLGSVPPTAQTSSTFNFKGENEEELVQIALIDAATHGHHLIVRDFLDAREFDRSIVSRARAVATSRWEVDVVELLLDRFTFDHSELVLSLTSAVKEKWGIEYDNRYEEEYFTSDPDKQARLILRLLKETSLDLRDPSVSSPLLLEAIFRSEQQGALRVLLEQGADPNTQFKDGETPLHLLASPHRLPTCLKQGQGEGWVNEAGIALLLRHGASITIKDHNNEMAFQRAAEFANAGTFVRYYLPDDSGLCVTNEYGETLLHRAAAGGKAGTVEYLPSKGFFDVNAATRHGWTPLLCALSLSSKEHWKSEDMAIQTARLLLDAKADPLAKTDDGWTILHLIGNFHNPGPSENSRCKSLEELYPDIDDEEDRQLAYEFDYWDAYDRTTAATDLVRELLTRSPELRDLVSHPSRVSYSIEEGFDYKKWEPKQFYQPILGWGGRLKESIARAKEPPTIVEGLTPLHWAADRGAASVASALIDVGGSDIGARDSEGAQPLQGMYRAWMGSKNELDEARSTIAEKMST